MAKSKALIRAIKAYAENGSEDEKLAIVALKDEWDTVTRPMTVYRGQSNVWGEKDPSLMPLFSTTTDRDVAMREFSDETGCVWSITLKPGVRFLDVNAIIGPSHSKAFEKELVVLGGENMAFKVSRDPMCLVSAEYGGPKEAKKTVSLQTLKERAKEVEGDLYDESETVDYFRQYMNPGEVFGGKRRKTRRRGGRKRRSTTILYSKTRRSPSFSRLLR